jgi:hypothetical protein
MERSDLGGEIASAQIGVEEPGADLEVSTTIGIPSHFDILVDGLRHSCCAIWRTDSRIGVQFETKM